MNPEDKQNRLVTILLYIFLTFLMVGYAYVRGGLVIPTILQLFKSAGLAGYILTAWYLLRKTWNKAGWEETRTIGLAISITYGITLPVRPDFLDPIPGPYPWAVVFVSMLCFFTVAAWIRLLIGLDDHYLEEKAPQWVTNARSWGAFFVLGISILFIGWNKLNIWITWYRFRQNPLPPMEFWACIIVAAALLIFSLNVIQKKFRQSSQ